MNPSFRFRFPMEVTTRGGTLATVDIVRLSEDNGHFEGAIWPLGRRSFKARWRRDGGVEDLAREYDIDMSSSEVADLLARVERAP